MDCKSNYCTYAELLKNYSNDENILKTGTEISIQNGQKYINGQFGSFGDKEYGFIPNGSPEDQEIKYKKDNPFLKIRIITPNVIQSSYRGGRKRKSRKIKKSKKNNKSLKTKRRRA